MEDYLRRPDISAAEREMFASAFPLYDLAISDNLLTPPSHRSLADMQAHDLAAVKQLLFENGIPMRLVASAASATRGGGFDGGRQ